MADVVELCMSTEAARVRAASDNASMLETSHWTQPTDAQVSGFVAGMVGACR